MPYVALKRLQASGKIYERGDSVPAENWPTRRALLSGHWIGVVKGSGGPGGNQLPDSPKRPEGFTDEQLTKAQTLMSLSVAKLEKAIAQETDMKVLEYIYNTDERKTAKEAVQARAQVVNAEMNVEAYEAAPITTLEEIEAALGIKAAAEEAVNEIEAATPKEALNARISEKDAAIEAVLQGLEASQQPSEGNQEPLEGNNDDQGDNNPPEGQDADKTGQEG